MEIIEILPSNKHRKITCIAKCFCWKEFKTLLSTLNKRTKSCWCLRRKPRKIKHIEWSNLIVIEDLWIITKKRYANYKCSCWNIKKINVYDVYSWKTKTCWCLQKEKVIWENNPNWKWWITELSTKIRSSARYSLWRKQCMERDNYTCVVTWIKWKWNLNVHHLFPLNKIIKDIDYDTLDWNDLLWDINNWVTLLENVHMQFHSEYWKTDFTKEDFLEFKETYNLF